MVKDEKEYLFSQNACDYCVDFSLAPERGVLDISLLTDSKSIRKPEPEKCMFKKTCKAT